jgi:rRNA pseudouridine-1189 N-methylase Emg1 (Nep1/Mra1 family)
LPVPFSATGARVEGERGADEQRARNEKQRDQLHPSRVHQELWNMMKSFVSRKSAIRIAIETATTGKAGQEM